MSRLLEAKRGGADRKLPVEHIARCPDTGGHKLPTRAPTLHRFKGLPEPEKPKAKPEHDLLWHTNELVKLWRQQARLTQRAN